MSETQHLSYAVHHTYAPLEELIARSNAEHARVRVDIDNEVEQAIAKRRTLPDNEWLECLVAARYRDAEAQSAWYDLLHAAGTLRSRYDREMYAFHKAYRIVQRLHTQGHVKHAPANDEGSELCEHLDQVKREMEQKVKMLEKRLEKLLKGDEDGTT